MPELLSAWVTLAASTRGMESDIRRAIGRATDGQRITPRVDRSRMRSEGDGAARDFFSRFESASDRHGRQAASKMGSAIKGGIAGVLTVGAGALVIAPFLRGMQEAVDTGLNFDRVANTFQGVTGSTVAQTNEMRAAARALGADTQLAGVSASDAALAITELAKGGLDVADSMTAARGTVQLATAAQIDAAEAAKIQANALAVFSLGAGDATHVADLLAKAANASSADLPDLALALQQGGSAAAGFGMTIEETLAILAGFSKMGINSSDAGTMLKTSLLAITDGGEPATEAINALGLSLYDAEGKFVGYQEMMRQVSDASNRMTQQQFQQATAVLFGSDAMRAAMIAGNKGPALFNETAEAMRNADGAAAQLAGANMQGLPGVIEGISNTAEDMKLTVYDAFNTLAQSAGGEALTAFDNVADSMNENKADMIGFFGSVGEAAVHTGGVLLAFMAGTTRGFAGLVNALGDTYGAAQKLVSGVNRLLGRDEIADQLDRDAQSAFGWADSLYTIADGMDAGVNMARNFGNSIDEITAKAQESARFTDALGGAIATIEGKDIVLKDNTPEVLDGIDKTKYAIEHLPDGRVRVIPLTDQATSDMNAWRVQQGQTPVEVTPTVSQAGASAWLNQLRAMAAGAPVPVAPGAARPVPPAAGVPGLLMPATRAEGGFGTLPDDATIQPAVGGRGLVQWAEPSTGGEAFIPLDGGDRSRNIWAQTGRLLGIFDRGGFNNVDAAILANVPAGRYTQEARGDLTQGLADCSSAIEDLVLLMEGQSTAGASMSTHNADAWLQQHGFLPGEGGLGDMRVAFNSGHMQATLPGGTPFNWGSDAAAARGGVGGSGADDPALTSRYYRPVALDDAMAYGSGSYEAPDAKTVREAEQRVADAESRLAIQEQQRRELDAEAKESQRMQADADVEKAKRERDDAKAELAEARRGEFVEGDASEPRKQVSSAGGDAQSFGQGLFNGVLQGMGLDGSVLSNPFEWPNVKSAMAAVNFGGGLLTRFLGGGDEESGAPIGGAGGGGLPGFGMLQDVGALIRGPGPGPTAPIQHPPANHAGTGAAPGPSMVVNGNVGWDPRQVTARADAHANESYRRNMSAVRPG